jgi:DNA-binding NtrC family response regulator
MRQFNAMIKTARASGGASEPVLAGNSVGAHALRQLASLAAQSMEPVQLSGPDGSGFLEIATAIHARSALAGEPFVNADCQSMEEDHFAIRWHGTLYIGDVGRLGQSVQQALLDWMNGADGQNVRVISAKCGSDQGDRILPALQQRLRALNIPYPPLASRADDIPIILQRIWAESSHPLPPIFERHAWIALLSHDWPANFDELKSFADRASRLYGGRQMGADQLKKLLGQQAARELARSNFSLKDHIAQEEKMFIIEALMKCNGVVQDAAILAGLNRTTLLSKMKRHGLARA